MLSDENIERINRQIENELRTIDSICSDAQEKADALDRIPKLKALLYPQPSTEEIMDQLAAALTRTSQPQPRQPKTIVEIFAEALAR